MPLESGPVGRDKPPVAMTQYGAVSASPASVSTSQRSSRGARPDARAQVDVAAKVEAVGDVVQVALDLGLRRKRSVQTHSCSSSFGKEKE